MTYSRLLFAFVGLAVIVVVAFGIPIGLAYYASPDAITTVWRVVVIAWADITRGVPIWVFLPILFVSGFAGAWAGMMAFGLTLSDD